MVIKKPFKYSYNSTNSIHFPRQIANQNRIITNIIPILIYNLLINSLLPNITLYSHNYNHYGKCPNEGLSSVVMGIDQG